MKDVTIKLESGHINFTPFAMAKMSNGLFEVVENYNKNDMPILKYFLYCASIELGLKASILHIDNSKDMKDKLRLKVGHSLIKAHNLFLKQCKETILDNTDIEVLNKINPYYKNKGLEYITLDVISSLMKGLSNFPELKDLRKVSKKINNYLIENKMYIN